MTEPTIDLSELLFELSPLNKRHAELLSERWANDVIQELRDTGVSVISGLGTLSAGKDGIAFQLDKELPIAPELPGVEGYSEAGALAHAALVASTIKTTEPPLVAPEEPAWSGMDELAETGSESSEAPPTDSARMVEDSAPEESVFEESAVEELAQEAESPYAPGAKHSSASDTTGDSDIETKPHATDSETSHNQASQTNQEGQASEANQEDAQPSPDMKASDDDEMFEAGLAAALMNAEASIEPIIDTDGGVASDGPSDETDSPQDPSEAETSEAPSSPESTSRKPSSEPPSSRLAPDNAPIPGGASSDDSSKKTPKTDKSAKPEPKISSSAEDAATRRKDASSRMPSRAGRRRAGVGAHRNEPDRRGLMIVAGLLVVVVISIASFWALKSSDGLVPGDSLASAEVDEATGQSEDNEMAAGGDSTSNPTDSAEGVTSEESQQPPPAALETEGPTEEEPTTPANPPSTDATVNPVTITADTRGYMLVVGSSLDQQDAERSLARFAPLGLPTGVVAYDEDGIVRYRMGVGIYSSASAADETRTLLADQLPEGTWVKRIR